MKLSEKICLCRKKQGLSQEALAQILGVSRQAVSKWETGDSEPEISKLKLLAQTFGVTVDWLLSQEDAAPEPPRASAEAPAYPDWMDRLPGAIGRMAKRYGWLAGGYFVMVGLGMAAVGGLARYLARAMMPGFWDGPVMPNPVAIMGGFMMAVGGVVALLGLILAIYLKKKSRE